MNRVAARLDKLARVEVARAAPDKRVAQAVTIEDRLREVVRRCAAKWDLRGRASRW